MYEIQCAMHPLYDCFVNVPLSTLTVRLGKLEVEKFQGRGGGGGGLRFFREGLRFFSGWGEIFSGGVEIFSGGVEIFFGG